MDTLREAPFGQIVRLITRNQYFQYPEEQPDFQCPHSYQEDAKSTSAETVTPSTHTLEKETSTSIPSPTPDALLTRVPTANDDLERGSRSSSKDSGLSRAATLGLTRTQTLPYTEARFDAEQRLAIEKTKSRPIAPAKTADGTILVDWYSTDDAANPQNWSQTKKVVTALLIDLYTFAVYCGSAIFVSSEPQVMERFGVGETKASLGLACYVLGYGLGPLIFSPMSEIPRFGRNIPYVFSFALYVVLAVPTALTDSFGGLLFCRFLQGFFGSPCLATGGASMQDMYSLLYLPYSLAFWVSASFAAPALGPMLSGFAVTAENWRWSLWEILWMSAPVFILWFFFLPETSASNILLRRAARLRAASGNDKIRSQTEIDREGLSAKEIAVDAVIKPFEIMFKDPAVLFTNLYTSLTYGIYYSFFEVFPLVFGPLYGFNLGETGVVFVCIVVACVLAMVIYFSYLHWFLIPDIINNGLRAQEWRLRPALIAVVGPTVGLFIFGWTANADIHWIAPVIGITIFGVFIYIVLQAIFVYIPMSYPQYAASLFASNDACRALFAFASILYSRPMYLNLGVAKGISLLGGLSVLGIIGMWVLYFYGAKLRARSKFAQS